MKIKIILACLFMAIAGMFGVPSASAANLEIPLYHYSPDDGYDAGIIYSCAVSHPQADDAPRLAAGQRSACTRWVYIRKTEALACYDDFAGWAVVSSGGGKWYGTGSGDAIWDWPYGCQLYKIG